MLGMPHFDIFYSDRKAWCLQNKTKKKKRKKKKNQTKKCAVFDGGGNGGVCVHLCAHTRASVYVSAHSCVFDEIVTVLWCVCVCVCARGRGRVCM